MVAYNSRRLGSVVQEYPSTPMFLFLSLEVYNCIFFSRTTPSYRKTELGLSVYLKCTSQKETKTWKFQARWDKNV